MNIKELSDSIVNETKKIIVGKDDRIKLVIAAILSDGHVLIDDIPGVGKTTLIKTISKALGCDFGRIQFVPDLLPSDIIGMQIYNQKTSDFELRKGPVMTNILLADEINRAIPRTQAALLEAMEERQITIDNESFKLPSPFLVFATQNPVENESTFKLPAAQMDRFLIKISMGYPGLDEEKEMLKNLGDEVSFEEVLAVTSADEIKEAQKEIHKVKVSEDVLEYIVALCDATRNHQSLILGASPRGARALYKVSKTFAAMKGREFVTPDDVKEAVKPVLSHRLVLKNSKQLSGGNAESVLDEILETVNAAPSLDKVAARNDDEK